MTTRPPAADPRAQPASRFEGFPDVGFPGPSDRSQSLRCKAARTVISPAAVPQPQALLHKAMSQYLEHIVQKTDSYPFQPPRKRLARNPQWYNPDPSDSNWHSDSGHKIHHKHDA